ncbi:MAG: hypothetical protein WC650_03590 [Candidatus Doudnabacteria bacterium]
MAWDKAWEMVISVRRHCEERGASRNGAEAMRQSPKKEKTCHPKII